VKAILSADLNWGIGYRGDLLVRIPEDMKFFKQMTVGRVIVMGRGTFESLPSKQPLKDRTNIVLSSSLNLNDQSVIVCRTLEQLREQLNKYPDDDICIIGGEAIFNQMLPWCSEVFVTKINKTFSADKYYMNIDKSEEWKQVWQSEWKTWGDIEFCFVRYVSSVKDKGEING